MIEPKCCKCSCDYAVVFEPCCVIKSPIRIVIYHHFVKGIYEELLIGYRPLMDSRAAICCIVQLMTMWKGALRYQCLLLSSMQVTPDLAFSFVRKAFLGISHILTSSGLRISLSLYAYRPAFIWVTRFWKYEEVWPWGFDISMWAVVVLGHKSNIRNPCTAIY